MGTEDSKIVGWIVEDDDGPVMDRSAAIERALDILAPTGEIPASMTLRAFRARPRIDAEAWADRVIDTVWEMLDTEHAGDNGEGAEQPVTPAVKEAARTFLRLVSADYTPWLLDLDHTEKIDVVEWLHEVEADVAAWCLVGCRIGDTSKTISMCEKCQGEGRVGAEPIGGYASVEITCPACRGCGWVAADG